MNRNRAVLYLNMPHAHTANLNWRDLRPSILCFIFSFLMNDSGLGFVTAIYHLLTALSCKLRHSFDLNMHRIAIYPFISDIHL
jgi:hypothetical protein